MIPLNEIDRADCPFCGRTVKLRHDVLMWHHRAGLHYQLAGHDTSCEGSGLTLDQIAAVGAVSGLRELVPPPPLLTMKRMARPTIVPPLPEEPEPTLEPEPEPKLTCLGCDNAVISPTRGVYCRVFSEIVTDLDFAVECPGWKQS